MKSKTLAALAMILGVALSTSTFAQGRHDEKPHGMKKPAAESPDVERVPGGSGRHDERPHGIKKVAKKANDVDKGKR